MKKIIKKYKYAIVLLVLSVIFASSSLVLTFDSTHYLTYVNILEGNAKFSTWDIARGPIFPIIIFINNIIFGKSNTSMLFGMFLYYIIFCIIVYNLLEKIFKNKNKWIFYIIYIFCILNPIILGYFHTMLTEYVAITLTMLSLLVSWNWWHSETKKEKIIYSLFYIIALPFSYFLKQPYLCITLIPMAISIIYALKMNCNMKRIKYYLGTFLISVIVLIFSIVGWNKILEVNGINTKTGRNSSSLLSKQLLNSIDNYKVIEVDNYNSIKKDKYITKKEKIFAKNELKKGNNIYVIEIYDHKKLLEKDILKLNESSFPSSSDTVIEIIYTFIKHPNIIARVHAKNYCALSSFCVIESDDGVMYRVTNKHDFLRLFENDLIAFKTFRNEEKYFSYPKERYDMVKYYLTSKNQSFLSKIITKTIIPTSIIFKFVILSLLLFIIIATLYKMKLKKKIKNKELYLFSMMFLLFSFTTLLMNDYVGAVIDRYAVVCFVPGIIGIVSSIVFIIENKKSYK